MSEQLPVTSLSALTRADGSTTYAYNGFTIVAAVNGPIEVQKRDELPEEAVLDVSVRPAAGVGSIRERYLESVLQRTLRHVIFVTAYPRTLIQLTLQVVTSQEADSTAAIVHQSVSGIAVLPALLQVSMLALLSSSISLRLILMSTSIAVDHQNTLLSDPSAEAIMSAASLHVLGFSSMGNLLVAESEGKFSVDTWEMVSEKAQSRCRAGASVADGGNEDTATTSVQVSGLHEVLKRTLQHEVLKQQRWKARN